MQKSEMPLSCLEMAVSAAGWPTAEPFSLGNKVCLHFLSSSKFNLDLVSSTCHSLTNISATDLSMCPIEPKNHQCTQDKIQRKL